MDRPYRIHLASLTLTKMVNGLIDPKLVLAWLLNAIGAFGVLIDLLVPVREAGALGPFRKLQGYPCTHGRNREPWHRFRQRWGPSSNRSFRLCDPTKCRMVTT